MKRAVAVVLIALVAACGGPEPAATTRPADPASLPASGEVEEVVAGLDAPWSIAFHDDRALVSERDGASILVVTDGESAALGGPGAEDLAALVDPGGEGGLLGLAVRDDEVYAHLTAADDNRIVRMTLDGDTLGDAEVVLDGIPKAANHNGGRIVFGPDGGLFVGTGDAGRPDAAQDPGSLAGKIVRVDVDSGEAEVFSLGHRNVQGLAFDESGQLWASEFGQNTWDELNRVDRGANHGWPLVEGTDGESEQEFAAPEQVWSTDEASPSGIAIADGAVFMAGLRGERLWRIDLDGGEPEVVLDGFGRLRDVVRAPDGSLWVLTNNTDGRGDPRDGDDRILRISPEAAR